MHTYVLGMYHSGHFYALFFLIYRDITGPHDLPASVLLDDSMFQLNAQQKLDFIDSRYGSFKALDRTVHFYSFYLDNLF